MMHNMLVTLLEGGAVAHFRLQGAPPMTVSHISWAMKCVWNLIHYGKIKLAKRTELPNNTPKSKNAIAR